MWVGGSSEAALRRAAQPRRRLDPAVLSPAEYGARPERLDKEAERAGRTPADVARAIVAFVSVGDDDAAERGLSLDVLAVRAAGARRSPRTSWPATPAPAPRSLARFVEAGAQHVAVFVTADDPLVQFEDLAGEFAGLVACPDRTAVAAGPALGRAVQRPTVEQAWR